MPLVVFTLLPAGLMALLVAMDHVERPLRRASVNELLETFLDTAQPDEVEIFVSQGFGPALDTYWRRRRLTRVRPQPTA